MVDGFMNFLDKKTNLLSSTLAKPDTHDTLHLNGKGISVLVTLLKRCMFTSCSHGRIVSNKLYSNALRGGPADPV